MEAYSHCLLVSAVGLLYALAGFLLSVLAALLRTFVPPQKPHTTSRISQSTLGASPTTIDLNRLNAPARSTTRRSKSVPSLVHLRHSAKAHAAAAPPAPALPASTAPSSSPRTSEDASESKTIDYPFLLTEPHSSANASLRFKLPTLKTTLHKNRLIRSKSSPELCTKRMRWFPHAPPSASVSTLHRTSSTSSLGKDKLFGRKVEKKRSQPSVRERTQPYGAPYFLPPPVPVRSCSGESA